MKLRNLFPFAAIIGMFILGQATAWADTLQNQYFWNDGESYAAFTMGTGTTTLLMTNGSAITGDVAIGNSNSVVSFDNSVNTINGNLYYYPGTTFYGAPVYTGSSNFVAHHAIQGNPTTLDTQRNQLISASGALGALPNAINYASPDTGGGRTLVYKPGNLNLNMSGQSITITGTANTQSVLNLNSFTLANSTLTLSGNANTKFVFNISAQGASPSGSFRLSNSQVLLSGGLTEDNVVFNIEGLPASPDTYNMQASILHGSVLAPSRTFVMNSIIVGGNPVGSTVDGVVAASGIVLQNSTIVQTPSSQ